MQLFLRTFCKLDRFRAADVAFQRDKTRQLTSSRKPKTEEKICFRVGVKNLTEINAIGREQERYLRLLIRLSQASITIYQCHISDDD